MNPPQVTVELHREKDLLSARTSYGKSGVGKVAISSCLWRVSSRHSVFWRHVTCVQVANCERRTMEQVRGTNYWMYTFTNAQLLNVKSADKSNSDRIVAENFLAMVFYTTLKIRNQDFKLHVSPLTACSVLSLNLIVEFLFLRPSHFPLSSFHTSCKNTRPVPSSSGMQLSRSR